MKKIPFLGWFSVVAIYVTPALAALAYVTASAGHGTYLFVKILFPYSMTLTALTGGLTTPLLVLALAQYFLYAFALDWARSRRRIWRGILLILAMHAVFLVLAFTISAPTYLT